MPAMPLCSTRPSASSVTAFAHVILERHGKTQSDAFEAAVSSRKVLECFSVWRQTFPARTCRRSPGAFMMKRVLRLPGVAHIKSNIALQKVKQQTHDAAVGSRGGRSPGTRAGKRQNRRLRCRNRTGLYLFSPSASSMNIEQIGDPETACADGRRVTPGSATVTNRREGRRCMPPPTIHLHFMGRGRHVLGMNASQTLFRGLQMVLTSRATSRRRRAGATPWSAWTRGVKRALDGAHTVLSSRWSPVAGR